MRAMSNPKIVDKKATNEQMDMLGLKKIVID